jgi:GNAT superfamily N-acetyltransferase
MMLRARSWRHETDLARMRDLLTHGAQAGTSASYAHPGVLDWATQFYPDRLALERNVLVWEDVAEGALDLRAWAIHMTHEGSFDLFVHPTVHGTATHAGVMDDYLAWAEGLARENGLAELSPFWAMEDDAVQLDLLRARGFVVVEAEPKVPLFGRSLEPLPAVRLPDGFTADGVRSLEDGELRAGVAYSAFRAGEAWPTYWARYSRFMGSAVYEGERDLLVRAPDGRGASACTIWFDTVNAVGLFEPVATHPDFRGRGLGKAVMAEGMRRMRAAGMDRAIVGFDPENTAACALYSSLGFAAIAYFGVARKAI